MRRQSGRLPLSLLVVLIFLCIPVCVFAQTKVEALKASETKTFSYSSQDRRDPFQSLLSAKKGKPAVENQKKTGYELDELKLVGVVKTGGARFAMMEDTQGRGMLFKKGDFLNEGLWLFDVLDEKVVLAHRLRGDIRKITMDIPRK
jgi:Tfp pilus assembly protein PilP